VMWGIHKKYPGLSWFENHLGGHVSLGPVVLYGENAMHWGVRISTWWMVWFGVTGGWLCFRMPFRCFGGWWPLYLYFSHNGTPGDSAWMFGGDARNPHRRSGADR